MLDKLFLSLSSVASGLLPIVGAVALVFLCILLKKAWVLIDELTKTVSGLDPTLKKVDESIEKLQSPLDTVVNLSKTIDDVSANTKSGISKASNSAGEGIGKVRTAVTDTLQNIQNAIKSKKDQLTGEQHPETAVPVDTVKITEVVDAAEAAPEEEKAND